MSMRRRMTDSEYSPSSTRYRKSPTSPTTGSPYPQTGTSPSGSGALYTNYISTPPQSYSQSRSTPSRSGTPIRSASPSRPGSNRPPAPARNVSLARVPSGHSHRNMSRSVTSPPATNYNPSDPATLPPLVHSRSETSHTYGYPSRSGLLAPASDGQAPALYRCVTTHPFRADKSIRHLALPFLTIRYGDLLDILSEAGHPATHSNLPIEIDGGKDCMLVARDERGNVGWALASFLLPLPPTYDAVNAQGKL